MEHFLLQCAALESARRGYLNKVIDCYQDMTGLENPDLRYDTDHMVQLIMDYLVIPQDLDRNGSIVRAIEPLTRKLCYALHAARASRMA